MESPTKLLNKSFALGVVVGGMLAGIAGLAVFLYIEGPGLIGTSFAKGRSADRPFTPSACERLVSFDDREALIEFGWFANRTSTTGETVNMGRKTDDEICAKATDMLRRNLTPAQFTAVTSCVSSAATAADVRRCWSE